MSALLLDTHVVVWWLLGNTSLPARIRRLVAEADTLHVSTVSLYEIAFKRARALRQGRPDPLIQLPDDLVAAFYLNDLQLLDITADQMLSAAVSPMPHGDPWDRILVAQARDLGIPLVTGDQTLRAQAGDTPVIW